MLTKTSIMDIWHLNISEIKECGVIYLADGDPRDAYILKKI